MSSVNSIASDKLARLIGTPKCPASSMCGRTTTFRWILGLSPALLAALPTRRANGRRSFEGDRLSSSAKRA